MIYGQHKYDLNIANERRVAKLRYLLRKRKYSFVRNILDYAFRDAVNIVDVLTILCLSLLTKIRFLVKSNKKTYLFISRLPFELAKQTL